MSNSIQLLIISDGKPGHENQSLGLAEAIARSRAAEIQLLRLDTTKNFLSRTSAALQQSKNYPKPDFVISTGHATHVPLLWLARYYRACSIVLMKPSLPLAWFGWCIAPEHDFPDLPGGKNLILSKGALNRVRVSRREKSGKLFLIGGPSKTHGYDEDGLIGRISTIAKDGEWQVADSRRTPGTFITKLHEKLPGLAIFPHQQTEPGWLAEKLSEVEEVWVTEDSVSMIYEALTSGARVGVLPMPRLKGDSRVIRGLEKLQAEGYFINGFSGEDFDAPACDRPVLAEADRCAAEILRARDRATRLHEQ
ncbi:mitochondrial fission ELM1 family protein [Luteolibacter algae]|uniref:Mitochondrial fission ELM1 family protein n=1 Tax=Luteolibacter algae TaxID=454151 RepID=A0ABW5D659_9BACT